MVVRRSLHRLGYRYRPHRRDLPGTPDLAFIPKRKALFVNGCFGHWHSGCSRAKVPTVNREFGDVAEPDGSVPGQQLFDVRLGLGDGDPGLCCVYHWITSAVVLASPIIEVQ